MNKLPSIFTALRSNLIFMITLPIFWLCFVLLYQPIRVVELLEMGRNYHVYSLGSDDHITWSLDGDTPYSQTKWLETYHMGSGRTSHNELIYCSLHDFDVPW